MARAMFAPVIGSPASSSQNMIWRYSSSATVAVSAVTSPTLENSVRQPEDGGRSIPAPGEGADDRLVDAFAHGPFRDGDVRIGREILPESLIALRAVGHDKEPVPRGGHVEVLQGVARGDDLLARVAARPGVKSDRLRLAGSARDQVIGVNDVDALHRPRDCAVVEKPKIVVAFLGKQGVRRGDVDVAAEEVRELAPGVPGCVPLELAWEGGEEQIGAPRGQDLLRRRARFVIAPRACEEGALAVDDPPAPSLVDVRGLP